MIPPIAALLAWPVISAALMSQLRLTVSILTVVLAGYLLLPDRFSINLPLLPPLDKHSVPVISALAIGLLLAARAGPGQTLPGVVPRSWLVRGLLGVLILGTFGTVFTNPDAIIENTEVQPALRPYDGFSMSLNMIMLILPLLLGRKFFFSAESHRLLLVGICIAACLYALPALYEVRMSPRLNSIFYGFFPHEWRQHVRGDGFRPLVFLEHGLHLALFLCIAILASAGMVRLGGNYRMGLLAVFWLFMTLVLAKSLGALMIVLVLLPVALFMPARLQLLTAAVIGMMVLSYPILRGAHLVPIDRVASIAASVSPERARSFDVRLDNEEQMLDRAQLRPAFGWGGYGRSRIRDERGRDLTIADGYWIIILGLGGWVRYIGEFGLMAIAPMLLFARRQRLGVTSETAVLALMLSAMLVDALPNNGITPVTWLIVGALWGRLELGRHSEPELSPDAQAPPAGRPGPTYSRDFGRSNAVRGLRARAAPAQSAVHARPGRYGRT